MSECENLIALVRQRLTAATEDVCGLFYAKMSEYEREIRRQRQLLDALTKSDVRVHRADVQQLLARENEEEGSPSLDQVDPPKLLLKCESSGLQQSPTEENSDVDVDPPKLLHFKQEHEALGTCQETEGDITTVTSSPVKEKPQSSKLQQDPTEENGDDEEDCAGRETVGDSDSDSNLEDDTEDSSDFSNHETDDSDDETKRSELRKPFSCPECSKRFSQSGNLKSHMKIHTGPKPFRCSLCSRRFAQRVQLRHHMKRHSKEKTYSCNVCNQRFTLCHELNTHKCAGCQSSQPHQSQTEGNRYMEPLEMNSEEEDGGGSDPVHDLTEVSQSPPCNQSGLNPLQNNDIPSSPTSSGQIRTGEKPFGCLVCGRRFQREINLKFHMRVHLEGEWFVCSVCFKTFQCRAHLTMHKKSHTEGTSLG